MTKLKTVAGLSQPVFCCLSTYRQSEQPKQNEIDIPVSNKCCAMTKEETILRSFFVYISNFSHDKAREVIEREKEVSRGSSSSCWSQVIKPN